MDQGNTRTNESGRGGVSRRAFIAGTAAAAVGVAAGLAEGSAAYAAPSYTKVRKLPGEFRRKDTQYTLSGTPYEVIDVTVQGDNMRLFVPHASPPSLTTSVAVVWYYHSNGGAYTDLSTAFKYGSDPLVDEGVVSVCPENGGTHEFASPKAVTAHRRAIDYVVALWRISYSFGRANSGGGSLMCWAFGNNFVPRRHGMYLAERGVRHGGHLYARSRPRRIPLRIQRHRCSSDERRETASVSLDRNADQSVVQHRRPDSAAAEALPRIDEPRGAGRGGDIASAARRRRQGERTLRERLRQQGHGRGLPTVGGPVAVRRARRSPHAMRNAPLEPGGRGLAWHNTRAHGRMPHNAPPETRRPGLAWRNTREHGTGCRTTRHPKPGGAPAASPGGRVTHRNAAPRSRAPRHVLSGANLLEYRGAAATERREPRRCARVETRPPGPSRQPRRAPRRRGTAGCSRRPGPPSRRTSPGGTVRGCA